MEFAPPPHNRLILPARRGCRPLELARCTGSDDYGPPRLGIIRRPNHSATTPQAAGHRIKSFEAGEIRRPHEPKPFGPALKHRYLLRGHAGDGTDGISPKPIAHDASDREGAERSRSKARGQPATTLQADARESFASGCYQSLGGRRTLPVSKSMPSQCSLSDPIKNNWRPSSTRTTEPDTAAIVPGVFSLSVAQSFIRDPIA